MKCKHPFRKGLGEFGCGRCLPCRINRQRLWTIRGLLEAGQHSHNYFATFTFNDESLPSDGSLSVREAQLLLKRIRERFGPFRYFLCGEYGERSWRPHYHALLFGLRDGCRLEEVWKKGFVHVSGVGQESIAYVVGYCLKGAFNKSGMRWLGKEHLRPEFSIMSRKPGLGAAAAAQIAQFYTSETGSQVLASVGRVSTVVRQGMQKWPLGRYLTSRIRTDAGIDLQAESRIRQLREQVELLSLGQVELNQLVHDRQGISERSGLRAEARFKRKILERKL